MEDLPLFLHCYSHPEIPLLIGERDSPLPILDSTRILARAALREAVPS
jgi:aspartate/glutamate racemase